MSRAPPPSAVACPRTPAVAVARARERDRRAEGRRVLEMEQRDVVVRPAATGGLRELLVPDDLRDRDALAAARAALGAREHLEVAWRVDAGLVVDVDAVAGGQHPVGPDQAPTADERALVLERD